MDKLLNVRALSRHFGPLVAVDGISFEASQGEVLGFLGPNGAGKSTTMKMITGYLAPSAGSAEVCGHDILKAPRAAKEKLGYLPEGAPAYGEMTPRRFLDFIADIRGLAGAERRRRIDQAIGQIHLEGVLEQPIETLSKGFKRRVGLAQAILHDPPVLILDEPTDGLDPNQKHEVRNLIAAMAKNKAIVISTHILEEVDAVCSRALIIANGRLVFSGTPAELAARSRYHNAVTIALEPALAAPVKDALSGLAGVSAVEAAEGDGTLERMTVVPAAGTAIAAEVQACLHDHGWQVGEMFVEPGRLDEVFRQITVGAAENTQGVRT